MTLSLPRNLANEACSATAATVSDDDMDMTCDEILTTDTGLLGHFDDATLSHGQRRYLEYIMESLSCPDGPLTGPDGPPGLDNGQGPDGIWFNTFEKLTLNALLDRATNMNLARSNYVCALVYMDRYVNVTMSAWSRNNVVLMYCVALMLAHKMGDDEDLWPSAAFAQLGCIDIKRISRLERHFLDTIQWNLYVDADLFQLYDRQIIQIASRSC